MSSQLVAFLAAFSACCFSAFSGGGAGLILMPALLFIGLPYSNALASLKLAVGFIGIGSGYKYWKAGLIDRHGFWATSILGAPWVALATLISGNLPTQKMTPIVGWAIIVMVLISLFKPEAIITHSPKPFRGKRLVVLAFLCIPIGFYSGWISAGGGIFTTLIYIHLFKFDQKHAVALTMAGVGIFWNGLSAVIHLTLGHVLWNLAPALISGAILGSYLGASLALKSKNKTLWWAFILSSTLSAFALILR